MAECTGRFFVVQPEPVGEFILDGFEGSNPLVHATFAKSLTFSGRNSGLDKSMIIIVLLDKIEETKDIGFKTAAYEGINVVILNDEGNSNICPRDYEKLVELATLDSKVMPEHIEELDLGAFKQKIDHGIPLRRQAYTIQETIYDRKLDQVASRIIKNICENGAKDTSEDCIVMNMNLLVKMSA